nr:E3 ubiquitin-protein ligase TRIM41-like isoform X1 [Pelodiscus sinensis]XP_025035502.1 E3 ubiquitin-protein ligase TRIM41-like isoform X1 [Pelodiscus sinensis]XP_025035505.1 E3 ubiquitin-protein ligase TRIM41-like isoform X1 [Pelodiscus sinensis]|eukprot:XP_006113138.3 E3 ubiquitin-protein ligase TRIM41-like isoform X1 [Pelodiscus sinensis]
MASTATAGELQEEATCPICLGYLTEPVTVACGHNFCRACLTRHCEQQGAKTPPACPQCRAPFQKGQFNPNTQLSNIVLKLQQLGPQPGAGRTEGLCERHQERLKLFCQEDGAAICLVCEKSRDHKSHTVVPVEEAAQEYKEKLQGALGPLRKQLEEARALTSKEEKKTTEWQRKVQAKREMIAGEFNKLHTLLREEEQLLLQRLAEEERETLQRLQEKVTKLSQQSASLQQLIAEIEGKCQQPVLELLKDVKSTLSSVLFSLPSYSWGGPCNDPRSENMKLPRPEPICTDLRNGYRMCLDLREALNRFAGEWRLWDIELFGAGGSGQSLGPQDTRGPSWELCGSWGQMGSVLGSLPAAHTHLLVLARNLTWPHHPNILTVHCLLPLSRCWEAWPGPTCWGGCTDGSWSVSELLSWHMLRAVLGGPCSALPQPH